MKQQIGNMIYKIRAVLTLVYGIVRLYSNRAVDYASDRTGPARDRFSNLRRGIRRRKNKFKRWLKLQRKKFRKRGIVGTISFVGLYCAFFMWVVTMLILIWQMVRFLLESELIFAAIVSIVVTALGILGVMFAGVIGGDQRQRQGVSQRW